MVSAFVKFLELLFRCEIDVSVGGGRLDYINGYVAKERVVRVVVFFVSRKQLYNNNEILLEQLTFQGLSIGVTISNLCRNNIKSKTKFSVFV